MEYYQYREDALHDTLNQAVDTILDYFPERGAIAGWDADTARRIGL